MRHLPLLALTLLLGTCASARNDNRQGRGLAFFETFSNHAILQRNVSHPIWGWARPKARVTLELAGEEHVTKADKNGNWKIELTPHPAGGPYRMTITSGQERKMIEDVYFGDVYLLSGQSNMEWRLNQSDPDGTRAQAIADPLIRQIQTAREYADQPRQHLDLDNSFSAGWLVGNTAANMGEFSGVGSYFAHYLRQKVDVPIGLIHSSWGGSRIEPWMSPEALGTDAASAARDRADKTVAVGREGRERFAKVFPGRNLPTEDLGEELGWLSEDFNDAGWPTVTLPTFVEEAGYPDVDGHFYFRRPFELTAEQAAAAAKLYLGAIDDGDWTYVNGQQVGSYPDAYATERIYEVPAAVLRPGRNTLAIHVYDGGYGGGFAAGPEDMRLRTNTGDIPLAGDFRYNIGEFRVDAQHNKVPTILYNAMIAPLRGMPLSGILWYQGESNAGAGDNTEYANLMRGLIQQWREEFAHPGVLPFYWVQLANFQAPAVTPDEPGWAVVRASQTAALDQPRTGMAVITDIGEADDIHPKNKWEVGRRLSLHALEDIYNRKVNADSPMMSTVTTAANGTVATAYFQYPGGGLKTKNASRYGVVTGFTVRDADGEWHFAPAALAGPDKVIVISPNGKRLRIIRYNWANNPDGNLFSSEGLPANSFEHTLD